MRTKKVKKTQNWLQVEAEYVTMHYVTHKKNGVKVIGSVKRNTDNADFIHSMILKAKKGGFLFVK